MFQKIALSEQTKQRMDALKQFYAAKRVFKHGPTLQNDAELHELLPQLYIALGEDIKNHAGISSGHTTEGSVLFNMKVLVGWTDGCTQYIGVWDSDTGECYYLGSRDTCIYA